MNRVRVHAPVAIDGKVDWAMPAQIAPVGVPRMTSKQVLEPHEIKMMGTDRVADFQASLIGNRWHLSHRVL